MSSNPHLPKGLADLLADTPAISGADLQRLKKAGEEIDLDLPCRAELQKGLFINAIMQAMNEEGLNQSAVARNMGCTRQNLHRILQEDSGVNFTIETMDSVAKAVKRRIEVVVLKTNESVNVMRYNAPAIHEAAKTSASEFKMLQVHSKSMYSAAAIARVLNGKYNITKLPSVVANQPSRIEHPIHEYAAA